MHKATIKIITYINKQNTIVQQIYNLILLQHSSSCLLSLSLALICSTDKDNI